MPTPFKPRVEKPVVQTADTDRVTVTLQAFTLYELDSLIGLYGASRAQVVAHIIEQWFHDNETKIAARRSRYSAFEKSRQSTTQEQP